MRLPKYLTKQVSTKLTTEDVNAIETLLVEWKMKYPDGDMPRSMTEFLRAAARFAGSHQKLFEGHIKNQWEKMR